MLNLENLASDVVILESRENIHIQIWKKVLIFLGNRAGAQTNKQTKTPNNNKLCL